MSLDDRLNIEMPTMGGEFFWKDIEESNGYRLQQNTITGHARILGACNDRVAWGTIEGMKEKMKIFMPDTELVEIGDIIGIRRKHIPYVGIDIAALYEHYAIYIGDDEVIHFCGREENFETPSIRKDSLDYFLNNDPDSNYFVVKFSPSDNRPMKINTKTDMQGQMGLMDIVEINGTYKKLIKDKDFHIYSGDECVKRAYSRLCETSYNLIIKNCEHFAMWCKTGVAYSSQVENIEAAALQAYWLRILRYFHY